MRTFFTFALVIFFGIGLNAQSKVCLKSEANGKFITVTDGQLIANADSESEATVFDMTNFGSCKFKTEDGKCVILNEDMQLVVSEDSECTPEGITFGILEEVPTEINSMQTSGGKYVCADLGLDGALYGNRTAVQAWERFVVVYK